MGYSYYTSLKSPAWNSILWPKILSPSYPTMQDFFFQAGPEEKPIIVCIFTNWRQSGHKHSPLCLFPSTGTGSGCREPEEGVWCGTQRRIITTATPSVIKFCVECWVAQWKRSLQSLGTFLLPSQAKDLSVKRDSFMSVLYHNFFGISSGLCSDCNLLTTSSWLLQFISAALGFFG